MIDSASNATRPVWIDPSWLSWESWGDSPDYAEDDAFFRAYEIHEHACNRLADNPSEFDRVDAITALRRVVALRVKALKEKYQLRELPTGKKPKHDLEMLEYFGIVRPFMLKRLIDIRNIVEHQGSSPPPTDECLMFVDLVWYFLRSTDGLIQRFSEVLIFRSDDSQRVWLSFFRGPFHEWPEISARLHASLIACEPRKGWIKIESTKVDGDTNGDEIGHFEVAGKVRGTDEQMKLIYDRYFRVSY